MLAMSIAPHQQIAAEEANRPCTDYTPQTVLRALNEFTGKSHTMESQKRLRDTLVAACDGSRICSISTIYSWYRLEATGNRPLGGIRTSCYKLVDPPRWDLYSHRVIPFSWFKKARWRHTDVPLCYKLQTRGEGLR